MGLRSALHADDDVLYASLREACSYSVASRHGIDHLTDADVSSGAPMNASPRVKALANRARKELSLVHYGTVLLHGSARPAVRRFCRAPVSSVSKHDSLQYSSAPSEPLLRSM